MQLIFEVTENTLSIEGEELVLEIAPFDTGVGAVQENVAQNKGDLYVYDGDQAVRLGAGADGQALVANSGEASGLGWGAAGAFATLTNKDSVELSASDVVVLDEDNDSAFRGTTTEGDGSVVGVLGETIGVNQEGAVYTYPGTVVTVNCDTGAISRGDGLVASATKGQAKAGSGAGVFAIALSEKASGSVGTVRGMLVNNLINHNWKQVWIPAAALVPDETNPCGDVEEIDGNKVRGFEAGVGQYGTVNLCFPDNWTGRYKSKLHWMVADSGAGDVFWRERNRIASNGGVFGIAVNTTIEISSAGGVVNSIIVTDITNIRDMNASDEDSVQLSILRLGTNASDTYAATAYLVGLMLYYEVD